MGENKGPGPLCSTRVGDDWTDDGTLCLSKSPPRGPLRGPVNPAKAGFDTAHAYSWAPEARRKRAIDLQIIGGDYARSSDVRIDSEDYLKQLIEIGSNGSQKVGPSAGGSDLQFFIVRGGGEGFLPDEMRSIDASNRVAKWQTTDGKVGQTNFDENDLLAVFDAAGKLVGSARLSRPTYVQGHVRSATTARVYNAWNGKRVFIYRSARPDWIPYLGLGLDDGFRDGSANKGKVVEIDLHKQENTNGCILIVDEKTPDLDNPALRTFEPALIRKILAARGLSEGNLSGGRVYLGTMSFVTISF